MIKTNAEILSPVIGDATVIPVRSKALDYFELMKPELTFLSVLSALCGYYLGTAGDFSFARFLHIALGTTLLGGGVGALNMFMERGHDVLMRRTERRPLPAGRLFPREAFAFGVVLSVIGILELMTFTNELTGVLALATFATYLFIYTPAKRTTPYSTILGGIPGALPPLMGWAAARNTLSIGGWILFAILFCWQMPHFYGLAWMYRKDYARAGYKMMTVIDPSGRRTIRHIVFFMATLFPATISATLFHISGNVYLIGAVILNCGFFYYAIQLIAATRKARQDNSSMDNSRARALFFASLWYLPALMLLLCIDKISR